MVMNRESLVLTLCRLKVPGSGGRPCPLSSASPPASSSSSSWSAASGSQSPGIRFDQKINSFKAAVPASPTFLVSCSTRTRLSLNKDSAINFKPTQKTGLKNFLPSFSFLKFQWSLSQSKSKLCRYVSPNTWCFSCWCPQFWVFFVIN